MNETLKGYAKTIALIGVIATLIGNITTIKDGMLSFFGIDDPKLSISDASAYQTGLPLDSNGEPTDFSKAKYYQFTIRYLLHKAFDVELHHCSAFFRKREYAQFEEEQKFYDPLPKHKSEFTLKLEIMHPHGSKETIEFYAKCKEGTTNTLSISINS